MAFAVQSIADDLVQGRVSVSLIDTQNDGGFAAVSLNFILNTPPVEPGRDIKESATLKAIEVLQGAIDCLKASGGPVKA